MEKVSIDPGFQSRGVGRQLMNQLISNGHVCHILSW
ncbi:hypothetical protein [Paenibacillus lautus]